VGAGPASLLGLKIANDRGWVAPGADRNGSHSSQADGKDGSK
jgi:NADH-quinone oxidoreductase subunit E